MASSRPRTLIDLFAERWQNDGPRVALHVPRMGGGFRQITWNELAADVARLAERLKNLNVVPGDRIAQVSENRYEWIVVDLAIHLARGVHVAIHSPLAGPQVAFQIADSGARVVFLSGPEQVRKLAAGDGTLPNDIHFVSFDPCEETIQGRTVEPFHDLVKCTDPPTLSPDLLNEMLRGAQADASPDDLATILYSSGTTGEPKGVMLTHGNLVSNARGMSEALAVTPDDLRLCLLPLSHIFARTCDLYTWLGGGTQLALVESRDRVLANCEELHPTLMNAVPYFYEKVFRALRDSEKGDQPGRLIELFGGRIRSCCSGGAALPVHVAEWFEARGLPLMQGYGLTETSPVISMSVQRAYKNGFVGRALSGVEIKIAADGEVLTRGPHVMRGYWKKPDATAEVLRDGWLFTGDLGELDADGFLKITGRKKELIVTAAGKNVAPVALEALLTEDPLILQAVVLGEGRNFLAAIIVPNPDTLREYILKNGIAVSSREEALRHPAVLELYRRTIDERLKGVSHHEQIGRFALLGRGFTVESDELTPTLKLRRGVICANLADAIEALYRP